MSAALFVVAYEFGPAFSVEYFLAYDCKLSLNTLASNFITL
jgi:hypothetical protein